MSSGRMTKEDVEEASGEGEQECWLGEGGCHESSEIESGSWRDRCQSGVNPDQNWIDDDWCNGIILLYLSSEEESEAGSQVIIKRIGGEPQKKEKDKAG